MEGSNALGADTAKVSKAVPEALGVQDDILAALAKSISSLEDRLGPVLGPPTPKESIPGKADKEPQKSEGPNVARAIRKNSGGIRRAVDRIKSLIERVEV